MDKKGFTLIELLVVIAIIALLMAIIIPSLRAAKELASGAVCVSNQRQLCLAWTSYASDNDEHLVGGSNYFRTSTWINSTPYRWVEYPLLDEKHNPETTPGYPLPNNQLKLDYRLNGIRAGRLFAYTGDVDVYHCRGDRNITKAEPDAAFRSYSICGLMNSESFDRRVNNNLYSPIEIYRRYKTSLSGADNERRCVTKTTEIQSPGNKYVFIEEDVTSVNQTVNAGGFALMPASVYQWLDAPALYHNDSSTFGFADGHAERHRWQDEDTIKVIQNASYSDPSPQTNEDFAWMVQGFIPKL